jgi:hypothetical protein
MGNPTVDTAALLVSIGTVIGVHGTLTVKYQDRGSVPGGSQADRFVVALVRASKQQHEPAVPHAAALVATAHATMQHSARDRPRLRRLQRL